MSEELEEEEYEESRYYRGRNRWRNRDKGRCIEDLVKDGWRVYSRGFPTLVAEKGNFMRLIVIKPMITLGSRGTLGKHKDALSAAFFKCFGVKYEIWEEPEPVPGENDFV